MALTCTGAGAAPGPEGADGGPAEPVPATDLRALYHGGRGARGLQTRVGRLSILRLQGDGTREVSVAYPFRSGDRFRLVVSSNQGGWLYLLHRSAGGDPELLWPRVQPGDPLRHLDDNAVQAWREHLVPPPPGSFVFDEEVGTEHFFVVLRPERSPPRLASVAAAFPEPSDPPAPVAQAAPARVETSRVKREPVPASRPVAPVHPPPPDDAAVAAPPPSPTPARRPSQTRIVQFSVRGLGGPDAVRGVVFDPGAEEGGDPHVYFSPAPGSEVSTTLFEFQLRHGE